MEPAAFSGFGSPVASPGVLMAMNTPEDKTAAGRAFDQSPLLFRRTPGATCTPNVGSSKRFSDWVMSTSPYAGQKTPPTVSMMSVKPGDENTPPRVQDGAAEAGPFGSKQHFQDWLKATSTTNWTPKRSPCAATPPPAPAPTPAGTPMSVGVLPLSAVSPASAEPRSRPLMDLGPVTSDTDSEDEDEATTTVGATELAAAAARMRAALAAAGAAADGVAAPRSTTVGLLSFTPPRAPAPTPETGRSPAVALCNQQLPGDTLATPMSQLSMSRMPGTNKARAPRSSSCDSQGRGVTGSAAWSQSTPARSGSQAPPASPVNEVIGLMMGVRPHAHHHHHHGPSRLQPPPSPEQQVIRLMMQDSEPAAAGDNNATAAAQASLQQQAAGGTAAGSAQQEVDEGTEGEGSGGYHSDYTSDSVSEDEIDVAELQELCGNAAANGTPIDDIIGMLLTPELKGTMFTPSVTAREPGQDGDGVGPRVLFADD